MKKIKIAMGIFWGILTLGAIICLLMAMISPVFPKEYLTISVIFVIVGALTTIVIAEDL